MDTIAIYVSIYQSISLTLSLSLCLSLSLSPNRANQILEHLDRADPRNAGPGYDQELVII